MLSQRKFHISSGDLKLVAWYFKSIRRVMTLVVLPCMQSLSPYRPNSILEEEIDRPGKKIYFINILKIVTPVG